MKLTWCPRINWTHRVSGTCGASRVLPGRTTNTVLTFSIAATLACGTLALAGGAAAPDGTTPLHDAAYCDDVQAVKRLLREGADAKAINRYGITPLTLACTNGDAAIIEALLKAGADPNAALPGGETALMTAARTGNVDAVKV